MEFVNLAPHEIVVFDSKDREILRLPKCTNAPRLTESVEEDVIVKGVPVVSKRLEGDLTELPPPRKGTLFVVSLSVAKAFGERSDLVVPDRLVLSSNSDIIGCRRLAKLLPPSVGGAQGPLAVQLKEVFGGGL